MMRLFPLVTTYCGGANAGTAHAPSSAKRVDDGDVLALIIGVVAFIAHGIGPFVAVHSLGGCAEGLAGLVVEWQ